MEKLTFLALLCVFIDMSRGTLEPPLQNDCKDDPNYADGCPNKANITGYCDAHYDFMYKNCRRSCRFCSDVTSKPPAPTGTSTPPPPIETSEPPTPIVCEDDPDYADGCPVQAAVLHYCQYHEDFMRKHCPMSCGFCSQEP